MSTTERLASDAGGDERFVSHLRDVVRLHVRPYEEEIHSLRNQVKKLEDEKAVLRNNRETLRGIVKEREALGVRVKKLEDEKAALKNENRVLGQRLQRWKVGLGEWIDRTITNYGGVINRDDLPNLNAGGNSSQSLSSSSSHSQAPSHSTIPDSADVAAAAAAAASVDKEKVTEKPPTSQESDVTMIGSAGVDYDYDIGRSGLSYDENLDPGRGRSNDGRQKGGKRKERMRKMPSPQKTVTTPTNPYTKSSRPPVNPYDKPGGKYKEVVRGRGARSNMYPAPNEEARKFFSVVAGDSNGLIDEKDMMKYCKQKSHWKNPTQTPPDFWEMDFTDERRKMDVTEKRNRGAAERGGGSVGEIEVLETPVKQTSKRRSGGSGSGSGKKLKKTKKTQSFFSSKQRMKFTDDSQE